ncbi:hypothetical protein OJ996_05435 [Luteolibacter sp. GHJ8]|uniref:Transposase n=1 Tax=Luteolibacter rhizosphaerae TaxID=2989719 RepID=A0ABT3FZK0_9BACT|nr:hypothetical protein [Luteolibacter rhizosphaerae]MCW1913002.1 hypothetical protein [Luteolibacter rhizosphaerae]
MTAQADVIDAPRYRHLNQEERMELCRFIRRYVPIANDTKNAFRKFARWQISLLLWRWTADAYCRHEGVIRPDAIKYDVEMLPATKNARELRKKSIRGLRHEHTVPRIALAQRIIDSDLCVDGIYALLTRHCRAVIVTLEEDQILSKHGKKSMGGEWEWETGCPYARYKSAGLLEVLDWNGSRHDCPDDAACRKA